ncbi:sterol carrier protein 2-like [Galleria mellonella]|uniref:propanoyl-CoA C-acyltransferase n=1 Tax=Galleria mellonella TaxID=7137 RepID=A0A6J3BWE9_GALME|nr:sterol carrier protein 2-like [Galleria mellonella]
MTRSVYVVGVGVTKFAKPGTIGDYPEFGKQAVQEALVDAGVEYAVVQQAVCAYIAGDSTSGQRVLYQVGMTGIPIYNINNGGATGGSGLYLAKQLVEGGIIDVALVLGFEKMSFGALKTATLTDRASPYDIHVEKVLGLLKDAQPGVPMTALAFGNAGIEHMKKYGTTELHFAKIAAKNYRHASKNPKAYNSRECTVEEILSSRKIHGPLTKLQCCPTNDGASAAILMSHDAVVRYGLQRKAVEIIGMEMATDTPDVFENPTFMKITGTDMTRLAATRLYKKTGISPKQIDVVELHDCFSCNELISYELLQLCEEGQGGKFVDAGANTYGGQVVVNPSGGLIAKGHPLSATGVAQCAELCWQLRGEAGDRQVKGARIGLQHNLGLGGAAVVALYRKGFADHSVQAKL